VIDLKEINHQALFQIHREATVKVIRKALNNEPSIEWLLEHQASTEHYFHQLGVQGEL
jgi:formaldehyde-activating enzyme involved in methanogenesis